MTAEQSALLWAVIQADRQYWLARVNGERYCDNDRGVEIGRGRAYTLKVAEQLSRQGLIETVAITERITYAFLGSVNPEDDLKEHTS